MSIRNECRSEENFRLTKRFRPSIRCQHENKLNDEICLADGFMECVHCERVCCLKHITEHQNELKQIRDQLVEQADEIFLSLTDLQSADNRQELRIAVDLWKKRMLKKIERNYSKLLEEIEGAFVTVTSNFETKKKHLVETFESQISTKLENLSNKSDFYPHELDDLRSSLKQMTSRIEQSQTSMINIHFGSNVLSMVDDDENSLLDDEEDFQIPKIVIENRPDVEQIVNRPFFQLFQIEFEENSIGNRFLYDLSNKELLIYNNADETLHFFNQNERFGLSLWPNELTSINVIKWSSFLNKFLLLCSQNLHWIDFSEQPYQLASFSQVKPLTGVPMKYLSVQHDSMLIKHGNGVVIDFYSLKKLELIHRWSKSDFYKFDDVQVDIHRIEFYSNSFLAMNVELNEENDVIDIFLLPQLQHVRRIENAYLIFYFSSNNFWIIKEKFDENSMNFALVDQHGGTTPMKINNDENIIDFRLFGKQNFLVFRQNPSAIQIQFHRVDQL